MIVVLSSSTVDGSATPLSESTFRNEIKSAVFLRTFAFSSCVCVKKEILRWQLGGGGVDP
jgi:hypothetical protein